MLVGEYGGSRFARVMALEMHVGDQIVVVTAGRVPTLMGVKAMLPIRSRAPRCVQTFISSAPNYNSTMRRSGTAKRSFGMNTCSVGVL